MDFNQIQSIIKDFEKSNITSLELEMENLKLKLNKNTYVTEEVVVKQQPKTIVVEEKTSEKASDNGFEVKSPLVGTFYSASSPKDEPFVKLGDKVLKGQTLCIIEAMKIMNEITAPKDGTISEINFSNGNAVGFDEVLMKIV